MTKIAIILGSTRPNRNGEQVARWILDEAAKRTDAEFELVDLRDFPLPHFEEVVSPAWGAIDRADVRAWTEKVAEFDGYVFVTPEYNHSISSVLKNALDYVYGEWNDKAAAIVSYGGVGGARAAEHLRLILAELQVAAVRQHIAVSLMTEFENMATLKPGPHQAAAVATMLDQVVLWSEAFEGVRAKKAALAEAAAA